jgi:predicted metal-dependent hydrolase
MNPLDWTKKLLRKTDSGTVSQEELSFEQIQVKVVRRRGVKNLTLRFQGENDITVTVPWRVSKDFLVRFLESKKSWIEDQQKVFSKWTPWTQREGRAGEFYYYLGQKFELRYGLTLLEQIVIQADPHYPGGAVLWCHWPEKMMKTELSFDQAQQALRKFYRIEAERLLKPRVEFLARNLMIPVPSDVKFRSQKSRWGSCSSKGSINLNRKLVGAPLNVIDSVIIHELCHLKHLNHSSEFWNLVNQHSPDHKKADLWLNEHQMMLF